MNLDVVMWQEVHRGSSTLTNHRFEEIEVNLHSATTLAVAHVVHLCVTASQNSQSWAIHKKTLTH